MVTLHRTAIMGRTVVRIQGFVKQLINLVSFRGNILTYLNQHYLGLLSVDCSFYDNRRESTPMERVSVQLYLSSASFILCFVYQIGRIIQKYLFTDWCMIDGLSAWVAYYMDYHLSLTYTLANERTNAAASRSHV